MVIILSAGDATSPLRRRLLVMLRKRAVVVLLLFGIVGKHSGRRGAGERERERERELDAVRLSVLDDPAHWSSPAASREPAIIACLASKEGRQECSVRRDEGFGRGCSQLRRHLQQKRVKRYWGWRRATRGVFVRPRLDSRSWTDYLRGTCPGGRLRVSSVGDGAVEFLRLRGHHRPWPGSCWRWMPRPTLDSAGSWTA